MSWNTSRREYGLLARGLKRRAKFSLPNMPYELNRKSPGIEADRSLQQIMNGVADRR